MSNVDAIRGPECPVVGRCVWLATDRERPRIRRHSIHIEADRRSFMRRTVPGVQSASVQMHVATEQERRQTIGNVSRQEQAMTRLKILSVAAAVALAVPAALVATPSSAATKVVGMSPGGGARTIGTFSGGGGARFGGGGAHFGGGQRFGGGGAH